MPQHAAIGTEVNARARAERWVYLWDLMERRLLARLADSLGAQETRQQFEEDLITGLLVGSRVGKRYIIEPRDEALRRWNMWARWSWKCYLRKLAAMQRRRDAPALRPVPAGEP